MSFTQSPISSGPTNSGTYKSSTVRRDWKHSLYFRMIRACWVGVTEFQCRLARFVISKWLELRGQLAVNQNGVWKAIWWIRREKTCATRIGVVPDVECRVGKGSDDGDGGAQNEIEGHKSRPRSTYPVQQPIHAGHRRKEREVKGVEWDGGAPNRGRGGDSGAPIPEEVHQQRGQYGVLKETWKHQSRLRSADGDWLAPIIAEEHDWGGMKQPTMCNWWVQWLLQ